MLNLIRERFTEVLKSIAPLIIIICLLQFTIVRAPFHVFLQFLIGCIMMTAGLVLFFMGIDIGILPMGRFIGSEMPQRNSLMLIMAVALLLGIVTTLAEPDVIVLSRQAESISDGAISRGSVLITVSVGVGLFLMIAMLRIIFTFPMKYLLSAAYVGVIVLSFYTPIDVISLAYDAGSVTTGALTAPVVIALALGLSSVLAGRSTVSESFGLLGFASIGPIVAVMLTGMLR